MWRGVGRGGEARETGSGAHRREWGTDVEGLVLMDCMYVTFGGGGEGREEDRAGITLRSCMSFGIQLSCGWVYAVYYM